MDSIDVRYEKTVSAWRGLQSPENAKGEDYRTDFQVRFAYNSGRIENPAITFHDTRDVFEGGRVRSYTGDVRAIFEIQNLKSTQKFLRDAAVKGRTLDETLLLETHRLLTQGTYDERRWQLGERPGAYKLRDYVVGANDMGSPAEAVKSEVGELLEEITVANEANILTVASYFHLRLESVHPFADGNGRVGRALLNYLLEANNHPPVIIYDADKIAYYGAIQAWDETADLEPMKAFLRVETIKSWEGAKR